MFAHSLFQAFDIAIDVAVKQLKEETEIFSVALVGRGGHKEVMVGHPGQSFAKLVGQCLIVATGCAHFVRLVHDDEVPMAAKQAFLGI